MIHEPDVFIIESLYLRDEKLDRKEGEFLSKILRLGDKSPIYYYIRTKLELTRMLKRFDNSGYRYLHLSCHGDESAIDTTFEPIPFRQLGDILRPHLSEKRLFVSTCSAVNQDLAQAIFCKSGCISLIGPRKPVDFGDAAITWASFYHMMFKINEGGMGKKNIKRILKRLQSFYDIQLSYFSRTEDGYGFERVPLGIGL